MISRDCGVSGRTVRNRLAEWRELGVFEQVCEERRARLEAPAVAHMDAMFVRARYSGDMVGLTRYGKGPKLQARVDDHSMPLAIQMKSANLAVVRPVGHHEEQPQTTTPRPGAGP